MRAGLLLAAVLLLAACAGAPVASPSDAPASPGGGTAPGATHQPAPTAPASPPATSAAPSPAGTATDGWRVLGSGMWLEDEVFAAAAAVNQPQLDALWPRLGQAAPVPAVDFEREIVLFLGVSGSSSCPERLERLIVDVAAGRVFGQWSAHDPNQPCTDDLQAQGLLIAVERELLPDEPFLFSLREDPICADCPDRPDQVVVDPTG